MEIIYFLEQLFLNYKIYDLMSLIWIDHEKDFSKKEKLRQIIPI